MKEVETTIRENDPFTFCLEAFDDPLGETMLGKSVDREHSACICSFAEDVKGSLRL